MFDHAINVSKFNVGYGDMLLADIEADQFAHQPRPGMNTPAWIVGHLAFVADCVASMLGAEAQHADWKPLFGNSSALQDAEAYPDRQTLIDAWHAAQDRLAQAVASADPAAFEGENPVARMKAVAPSMKDFVTFVLTSHAAVHLGQLSSWRRAMGKPALF
ncbi:MAG: DUF664 domain-containing protein [Planctomycetes bacterium]|jgi:hypothetical protein|nr:DUF664 domain-containing protein [Planctomycetota bacterium]